MCVCVCVRERERVCVCVCVIERERERERESVCVLRGYGGGGGGGASVHGGVGGEREGDINEGALAITILSVSRILTINKQTNKKQKQNNDNKSLPRLLLLLSSRLAFFVEDRSRPMATTDSGNRFSLSAPFVTVRRALFDRLGLSEMLMCRND